jgi:hypothetical protein
MLTLREGRGEEDGLIDWAWVMAFVKFAESSIMLVDGERASDLRPARGLGVKEGVGRPWTAVMRLSGVNDKGRRLRLAGRCRDGATLETASVGVTGTTAPVRSEVDSSSLG